MMNDPTAAFTVKEFLVWARISRTTFYQQVASNRIEVKKLGKKTLVLRKEAQRWLGELPALKGEVDQ